MKYEEGREKALDTLFSVPSPVGLRNRILRKNIQLVEDASIKEARGHIIALSQKKGLWNRKVRKQAKKVLEKLDGRKD